jgi:short-subunit dehydrogenase
MPNVTDVRDATAAVSGSQSFCPNGLKSTRSPLLKFRRCEVSVDLARKRGDKGMARELRGARVLITGASGGIGRCLAEQAASAGARLALVARSADKLRDLAEQLSNRGTDVLALPADVTSEVDRRRILDAAADHFGGLDVLINNAGVGSWGHFADSSEEIVRQVLEVNFFAPAELIRRAIPLLGRRPPAPSWRPAIVNIASMCGRRGVPAWSEYSASKFALCGLTEALRGELVRFGIDILLVVPGLTNTGLGEHLLRSTGRYPIDFGKGMPPQKVAAGVLRALRKNRTETVLGWEARWILRANRFFPRLVDALLARQVRRLYASFV